MLEDYNPQENSIQNMQLAGAGNRLAAAILDWLIIGIPFFILSKLLFVAPSVEMDSSADPQEILSLLFASIPWTFQFIQTGVQWLYFAYFESSESQATLGKKIMKIKVVSDTGDRISFLNALGRVVSKILSSLICCIGYFMILFRKDEKGLHDLIANTYVVKA